MKRCLPDLTLFALIALSVVLAHVNAQGQEADPQTAAQASVAGDGAGDGKALIDRAIFNLESHYSIAAEIRHEVDMFGRQLLGNGHYYEQRAGSRPRVRMELRIPFGDRLGGAEIAPAERTGALVRVCDGRFLWTYERLLNAGKLRRVDLDIVQRAIEQGGGTPEVAGLDGLAGAGGLSKILRGLDRSFHFEVAGKTTLLDTPVWRLCGQWRPELLLELLPDQKEAIQRGRGVDLAKLPSHLPTQVVLLLGEEDLFPYRFEYRRRDGVGPHGATEESREMVTMQLLNVNINAPIEPSLFDYRPGDIEVTDDTDNYLRALGLETK